MSVVNKVETKRTKAAHRHINDRNSVVTWTYFVFRFVRERNQKKKKLEITLFEKVLHIFRFHSSFILFPSFFGYFWLCATDWCEQEWLWNKKNVRVFYVSFFVVVWLLITWWMTISIQQSNNFICDFLRKCSWTKNKTNTRN